MAPTILPTKPALTPQMGAQRPSDTQPNTSRAAESEGFEPASYRKAEQAPVAVARAKTGQQAPAAAKAPHTFTLQTLSAYAGVIVGQLEKTVAPLGPETPQAPRSSGPDGPPEPPGSRLNIKI